MDAKTRANFINSVAGGQNIPCPNCNALNEPDSKFCAICGKPLVKKTEEAAATDSKPEDKAVPNQAVPFQPIQKEASPVKKEVVQEPVKKPVQRVVYQEPESVFAEGLPSWDVEPPQVMVRRKRK